jgi:hypothetical protein
MDPEVIRRNRPERKRSCGDADNLRVRGWQGSGVRPNVPAGISVWSQDFRVRR